MIFDRYLFRSLAVATIFVALVLASVIFLTQSLRFLELVIESGASGASFLFVTLLTLPRFMEVILPIALMAAVVFTYHRMTMDSELVAMRAAGASSMALARPALILAGAVMLVLFFITAWLGPASGNAMHQLRLNIKAQYSTLLFREGVFNQVGRGLTVFVRDRSPNGDMNGLMIHDSRADNPSPVTIVARRGVVVSTDTGQQVVVYDGSRQAYDPGTGNLTRLDFSRYTIDLPEHNATPRSRWQEPDERTLFELMNIDPDNAIDMANRRDFMIEIHRRVVSPFLAPAFTAVALSLLLLGAVDRRGMGRRIIATIAAAVVIQGLYLAAFNVAQNSNAGLVLMYALVFVPLLGGFALLSGWRIRR